MVINVSNAAKSSAVPKPYKVTLSCRNCSEVRSRTESPIAPIDSIVEEGVLIVIVIPPIEISTESVDLVVSSPLIDEIKY
jgi:hypothetical protein